MPCGAPGQFPIDGRSPPGRSTAKRPFGIEGTYGGQLAVPRSRTENKRGALLGAKLVNQTFSVSNTKLDGVRLITPPTIFEDFRGTYVEIYNQALYAEAGVTVEFVQDDIST